MCSARTSVPMQVKRYLQTCSMGTYIHASPKQGCRYSRPPVATHMFFKKQFCHGGRNEDLYITCFDPCTYQTLATMDNQPTGETNWQLPSGLEGTYWHTAREVLQPRVWFMFGPRSHVMPTGEQLPEGNPNLTPETLGGAGVGPSRSWYLFFWGRGSGRCAHEHFPS